MRGEPGGVLPGHKTPITRVLGCARAASGHVVETAIALMKSRRRICLPQGLALRPRWPDYISLLRSAKWGSEVRLHGSNFESLMSALGQKQTFRLVRPMSALPTKANIGIARNSSGRLAMFSAIRRASS